MTRTILSKRRARMVRSWSTFVPLLMILLCGENVLAQRAFGPENEVRVPEMFFSGEYHVYRIRPFVLLHPDAGVTVFSGHSSRRFTWDMQDLGGMTTMFETYYAKYLASGDVLVLTRSLLYSSPPGTAYDHLIRTLAGKQTRDSLQIMQEEWKYFDDDEFRGHVLPIIVAVSDSAVIIVENKYFVGYRIGVPQTFASLRVHNVHPGLMTRREPTRTVFTSFQTPTYDHATAAQLSDGSIVYALRLSGDGYPEPTHYGRSLQFQWRGVDSLTTPVLIDSVAADSCDLSDQIVPGDNNRFHILRTSSRGTSLRASTFDAQGAYVSERTVLTGMPGWIPGTGNPNEHIADYSLVQLSTGQFVIAWTALESDGDRNVYVAGFSSEFTPLATPKRLSSVATGEQTLPQLAILHDTIWAAWYHTAGGRYDLYLRKLTATDVAGVLSMDMEPMIEKEMHIRSFPNPFTDRVQLEYQARGAGDESTVRVRVLDLLGRAVYTNESVPMIRGRAHCIVDAAAYPAGVYIAEVSDGRQVIRSAVVRSSRE